MLPFNEFGLSKDILEEADVVLEIAKKVKTSLEAKGVVVDLLPATIPIDYFADAFISIHADGNNNSPKIINLFSLT